MDDPADKKSVIAEKPHGKRLIYVSGIVRSVTEDRLREYFAPCGEMTHCEILLNRDGIRIGEAYLEFATEIASKACIALHGAELDGSRLIINHYNQKSVIIYGIPRSETDNRFNESFAPCGEMTHCVLILNNDGLITGIAAISFATEIVCKACIALHGADLDGHRHIKTHTKWIIKKKDNALQ